MKTDNKAQMIVSSKLFRSYLKGINKLLGSDVMELDFSLDCGMLHCFYDGMHIEHKGNLKFSISVISIRNLIKALKYAPEQPICIKVSESSNNFELHIVY